MSEPGLTQCFLFAFVVNPSKSLSIMQKSLSKLRAGHVAGVLSWYCPRQQRIVYLNDSVTPQQEHGSSSKDNT